MSCSPFDIRDYFLEELAANERRQVEAHVNACSACRDEFDRLRVTQAALRSVADEEIPQRIAFVSDKIFEPSPWKRRLAAFWNSGARLGFASAAMLSCALIYSAARRPAQIATAPPVAVASAAPVPAATPALSGAEIQQRIDDAVSQAIGSSEKRQQVQMAKLMRDLSSEHASLLLAADTIDRLDKDNKRLMLHRYDSAGLGDLRQ